LQCATIIIQYIFFTNQFKIKKMKQILFSIVLLLIIGMANAQYKELVWSDEFDYTGLPNTQKWSYDVGGSGWGNNELQYYTENRTENARVENGTLIIEARKESFGGMNYTSARLVTRNKGDWKYARIEVRAKVAGGRGTWPAIWMLPTYWEYGSWPASGEIDIMEYVGYDPTKIHGTVHTQAFNHSIGTQVGTSYPLSDAETNFHVYTLDWSETKIDLYVDENKYFTFNSSSEWEKWPFNKTFHLLLNVAIGGNWGGAQGVDDNIFPTRMVVDYVRVYQDAAPIDIVGNEFVKKNETSLTYSAANIVGGNYVWSVPSDAQIIEGQGTNSIKVNWGQTEGDVKLVFTKDEFNQTYTKTVKLIVEPSGDNYSIHNFENQNIENIKAAESTENTFTFSVEQNSLKVKYDVQNAAAPPYFTIEFDRPIDMSNLSELAFDMKTFNLSNSVILRADLVDASGRKTDATPVFSIYSVNNDGNFHTYQRDFTGHWITTLPYGGTVDKSRIVKAIFYVNYGVYGKNNKQDSLWFDNIQIRKASTGVEKIEKNSIFSLYPNPCQDFIKISMSENAGNDEIITEIYAIDGQIIHSQKNYEPEFLIQLLNFEKGNYFIKIKYKNKIYIHKIIKI